MFGKKKKEESKNEMLKPEAGQEAEKQIHVMPEKFYVPEKKKPIGMIIIIAVGVLLIGGLIATAFYLNATLKATQSEPAVNENQPPAVNQNQNTNVNTNINTNANTNINTNADVNINANDDTNVNANVNANANANANANTNVNTNVNSGLPTPLPSARDADFDRLTELEEELYGTDKGNNDSDGDGYKDGGELLSGYDPSQPNATLADSNLFADYSHSLYSIIYPSAWEVKEQGIDGTEVLFTAENGEFIEVLIIENNNDLSLLAWYKKQFPNINDRYIYPTKVGDFWAVEHPDERNFYLMPLGDQSKIYLLTYNVGNQEKTNFAFTFEIMVKNFILK